MLHKEHDFVYLSDPRHGATTQLQKKDIANSAESLAVLDHGRSMCKAPDWPCFCLLFTMLLVT